MPEQLRPDQLGVLFYLSLNPEESNPFARRCMMAVLMNGPGDLETNNVKAAIQVFSNQVGLPVAASYGGLTTLLHPRPALARAILAPQAAGNSALVPEAMQWRRAMLLDG